MTIEAAVSVLRVEPGDIVIVTLPDGIDMDCQKATMHAVRNAIPEPIRILYHVPKFSFTIIRPDPGPSAIVEVPA